MTTFEMFLRDIYRMDIITGRGRPDAEVIERDDNLHLAACDGTVLTHHRPEPTLDGRLSVVSSLECGHGDVAGVEFVVHKELWILEK